MKRDHAKTLLHKKPIYFYGIVVRIESSKIKLRTTQKKAYCLFNCFVWSLILGKSKFFKRCLVYFVRQDCSLCWYVLFSACCRSRAERVQEGRIGEDPGGQRRSHQRLDPERLFHTASASFSKSGIFTTLVILTY